MEADVFERKVDLRTEEQTEIQSSLRQLFRKRPRGINTLTSLSLLLTFTCPPSPLDKLSGSQRKRAL